MPWGAWCVRGGGSEQAQCSDAAQQGEAEVLVTQAGAIGVLAEGARFVGLGIADGEEVVEQQNAAGHQARFKRRQHGAGRRIQVAIDVGEAQWPGCVAMNAGSVSSNQPACRVTCAGIAGKRPPVL